MRDYFGEILSHNTYSGGRAFRGREVPSAQFRGLGAATTVKTPIKVHLIWGLLLIISVYITWRVSSFYGKIAPEVKRLKARMNEKNRRLDED